MPRTFPPTARSLPMALIRAREGVMAPIRDMLSETGITEQQWRVLRVLSENGPLDATSLADRASLLFPSLTRIATKMREKGLITQTRDEVDRRRHFIAITEAGQKIIDERAEQSARIVADIRATLGEENYETLLDLLAMLDPGSRD
ncbi:homoprotocatechuate degradation operon regulator, HpaR [Jannaschia sp. EhC01]|uniref:Homoprotocatechuate degradation operon regulator HpaR n=1 Tax=Gymnodinialimonas phycosphaerae TaxID=2841589 RepID=A0A975YE60_9RHOB|nr:homoprotocatechuate degradation operon regulator HpaR [Gymnodinialimonas phycosphaerae]MBY4893302.1 homoprotocatechuate degradation operon regulator HpaR [Gymnodinialimonas phycosphaerae]OAN70710.1 homoprotocatechuate degradation operon regulator, HpaR [Jannaschia sp. EhC01]